MNKINNKDYIWLRYNPESGLPVCTNECTIVTVYCNDMEGDPNKYLVTSIDDKGVKQASIRYSFELFNYKPKKAYWINVYNNSKDSFIYTIIFDSKEKAEEGKESTNYIDTIEYCA